MKGIPAIYQFAIMTVGIATASIFIYKVVDTLKDTDSTMIVQYQADSLSMARYMEESLQFHEFMFKSVNDLTKKADSTLVMVTSNRRAMKINRDIIIEQIKRDSSMSKEDYIELTKPLMEDIEHLKKNSGMTPYVLQ